MKKAISIALLLVLCLACFSACAIDTTGLLEAAPGLIERSTVLNEIYYGEGIPYDENGTPIGNYYPADKDYLREHGFATVDGLKALTAEVFSTDYCMAIYASSLSGFAAEGSGYIYARYSSSQPEDEDLRDENETILVLSTAENKLAHILSVTYDYESIRLGAVGRNYATVLLSVTTHLAADEDHPAAYTTTEEMAVKFVYEEGWRIDSATY